MRKLLAELFLEIKSAFAPLFVKRTLGGWIFLVVLAVFFISDRFDSVSSLLGKMARLGTSYKFVIDALQTTSVQVVLFLIGSAWIGIACYLAAPKELFTPETPQGHFDLNNAFEIDGLAVSNLQNRTEMGHDQLGTPGWCLDCLISIHNRHPTQDLTNVTFRIIGITPPMVARPAHHPRTQDTMLRRVEFAFTDLACRNVLAGDQTGHIKIFQAAKHVLFSEAIKEPPGKITETVLVFDGLWPNNLKNEFAPAGEYLLTVEVTGSGVGRKEERFIVFFPTEFATPVFTLTKFAGTGPSPMAKNDQDPRSEAIRHEAFERRQAEEGIAIHLPRADEVKRPIHFYYDQFEALIQTGSEMLEKFNSNTAPMPAKGEVDEWARRLDDVATCCATVAERQALKNSRIGLAFEGAFLDIAAVTSGEHHDTITEIFSKLTVAKGIAARIHKEDKG
jgi:hypothetical protein